jgi:hypothetical protein
MVFAHNRFLVNISEINETVCWYYSDVLLYFRTLPSKLAVFSYSQSKDTQGHVLQPIPLAPQILKRHRRLCLSNKYNRDSKSANTAVALIQRRCWVFLDPKEHHHFAETMWIFWCAMRWYCIPWSFVCLLQTTWHAWTLGLAANSLEGEDNYWPIAVALNSSIDMLSFLPNIESRGY